MALPKDEETGFSAEGGESVLARASALVPDLEIRATACEEARQVPRATVEAYQAARLVGLYAPTRFGGHGAPMETGLGVIEALARGCGSSAWVLAVYQIHAWLVSLMAPEAQEDVFGGPEGANTVIAGSLQPRGTLAAVTERGQEGFRLEGGPWPFASGGDYGRWAVVGAMIQDEGAEPAPAMCLLAPDSWTLEDDWFVSGLKGTGSKSIVAAPRFVPARHVTRFSELLAGTAPGQTAGADAVQRAAFVPMLTLNVTAPALGTAVAALADFMARADGRFLAFSGEMQGDAGETHIQIAEASAKADAARLVLRESAGRVRQYSEQGVDMPLLARAQVRRDAAWAVRACVEAVDLLSLASGGGALHREHPMQRWQRDVHAIAAHAILPYKTNMKLYGRAAMGKSLSTPFV
ncbi:MAG: acyl-CoA dehydrogenase family protein [Alphaproteobacteria bacterium]